MIALWLAQSPRPEPTILQKPPASPFDTIVAIVAIVLALGAALIGYRIIRGGRGL